jgi:photosystem II stability/assembly factor-like uncharacterized protein
MNLNRKKYFLLFVLPALFLVAGCTVNLGSTSTAKKAADGGVWKSVNAGKNWQQVVAMSAVGGKVLDIASVDVRRMILDPGDVNTIYLATENSGIIYTYNGGASWQQFADLNKGKIRAMAVDAKDKCNLFAVAENKLYKSVDCGRFWKNIYYHQDPTVVLNSVAVDYNNGALVYLATSEGEVLKSADGGQTWTTVERVKNGSFVDLVIDSRNSRMIYAATAKNGIFKTVDAGIHWQTLGEGLKAYTGSHEYKSLIIDSATPDSLILVSKYGMLRSRDAGQSWEIVELLPAPKATAISAVAVNPLNSLEIYYTTATTLVKSVDGGLKWSSQKLPFSRLVNQIIIDPSQPQNVYLGTFKVKNN